MKLIRQIVELFQETLCYRGWCFLKECYRQVERYITRQYKGSHNCVPWIVNIVASLMLGALLVGTGLPWPIDFLLFSCFSFFGLMFVRWIFAIMAYPLRKQGFRNSLYSITLIIVLMKFFESGAKQRIEGNHLLFLSFGIVLIEVIFGRTLYILIKKRKKSCFLYGMGSITLLCNIVMVVFLLSDGWEDPYRGELLNLKNAQYSVKVEDTNVYTEAIQVGPYEVGQFLYGQKKEGALESNAVDLSYYVNGYSGFNKVVRDLYWGFSINEVPLRGKIWYPKEGRDCPVLFLLHGNHNMVVDSYLGYDYLGNHLASKGYVVVSVDENVLNYYLGQGFSGENNARAVLLLENMKQIRSYNSDKKNPLYQRLDMNNLALAGHSRGGEAVAIATLFNELESYPDNGNVWMKYGFHIRSVIGIASTNDQYQPGNRDVVLEDVNYLAIHGSNDQDVTSFRGIKQYENIRFTGKESCFKSTLYIMGANHGQFNSLWKEDSSFPGSLLLNKKSIIQEESQQEILKGYVTAFLDTTLKGEEGSKQLFTNYEAYRDSMPKTVYVQNYQDSTYTPIAEYEEDLDMKTASVPRGEIQAEGFSYWREQKVLFQDNKNGADTDTTAVLLKWSDTRNATYEIELEEVNQRRNLDFLEKTYLQFDIANYEKEMNHTLSLFNFTIQIKDIDGNSAKVTIGDYASIYPPLPVRLFKLQWSEESLDYKMQFQTVRIPLQDFINENSSLNMRKIDSITFEFDKGNHGRILLDHIGISE